MTSRTALATKALTATAIGAAVVFAAGGTAVAGQAPGHHNTQAPVVTRAALDPSLVAGRGADLGFVEQEAENAATTGTVIGPGRSAYTLPAEASGRRAVTLAPGQY